MCTKLDSSMEIKGLVGQFMFIYVIDINWIQVGAGIVVLLGIREKFMNIKNNEVEKQYNGDWKAWFNCKVTSKIKAIFVGIRLLLWKKKKSQD